jgi:signal transduction histidine kinase/CheY-like chemotaxis protein
LKIRTYLIALVGSIFVPFTIFAGTIAYRLAQDERAASVEGLRSTVRALALAIDRNMADVSNSLKVLATAELLQIGEFEGLHRFATRVVNERPELQRLVLVQTDGRILFDTDTRYDAHAITIAKSRGLEKAIATGLPVIGSDIAADDMLGTWAIQVFVPARVNGEIKYALVASLRLFVISAIFRDQQLPDDWTGVVLNDRAVILGRSRSPEIYVGEPAPSDLSSAVSAQDEGIAQYLTQEGWPMLAAFAQSRLTNWTVVLGMPVASADNAAGRTLAVVIATGAAVSLLALALAAFLGRRISHSVLGLLEPALAVARGEPIMSAKTSSIAEIQGVTDKLFEAAKVLAEHERQRQQAEDHLARAQRVAAIGSWELVLESGEFHWSDQTFRIFGVRQQAFRPTLTTFLSLVVDEDLAKLRRPFDLALDGKKPSASDLSLEFRVQTPSGAFCILRQEGELVVDAAGDLVALIGTVQDVTRDRAVEAKRRELEQQLRQTQKMEALGQLTGGIAHDFNNLLAVIVGNLEMAVDRQKRGLPATDLDEASLRAAARGAALTGQLLAFARRQPLRPICQDLRLLIDGMVPILKRALTPQVELLIDGPGSACWAEIDHGQFEAALLNLVINARDAMPNGGTVTIAIRGPLEGAAPNHVEVLVKDTGAGMTHDVLARAFEPFFTTKDVGKGSGLGLSMVYGFVRQSGGRVDLASQLGKGTLVTLHFRSAEGPAPVAEPKKAPPIRFEHLRVLLVEDEFDVRETVRAMLSELGATVVAAADGHAALGMLKADQSIDTIVADIVMPGGMDGIALAASASALRPDVRIAFMSGHAELDRRTLLAINERPFLAKPFRKYELAAALEALA